jgi:hypothetical protein
VALKAAERYTAVVQNKGATSGAPVPNADKGAEVDDKDGSDEEDVSEQEDGDDGSDDDDDDDEQVEAKAKGHENMKPTQENAKNPTGSQSLHLKQGRVRKPGEVLQNKRKSPGPSLSPSTEEPDCSKQQNSGTSQRTEEKPDDAELDIDQLGKSLGISLLYSSA